MDIRKLQRQAASSVDELLSISGDMDTYVIAAYGQAPQEVVAMQCRIQLERLKRLGKKLAEIREELAGVTGQRSIPDEARSKQPEYGLDESHLKQSEYGSDEFCLKQPKSSEPGKPPKTRTVAAQRADQMGIPGMSSPAQGLSEEQRRSITVTQQLIAQNLLIIAQKEELLNGFLAHSDRIEIQQKCAKELQDTEEIIRLKEALLCNS